MPFLKGVQMKRLSWINLVGAIVGVTIAGCSNPNPPSNPAEKFVAVQPTYRADFKGYNNLIVKVIDGCEYIGSPIQTHHCLTYIYSHKGNCTNAIHVYNK